MKRYLGLCLLAMTMQTPAEPITDPLPAPKPEEPASVWDLSDLYPDVASWDDARDNATAQISAIGECEGVLDDSANVLADCLNRVSDTYKAVLRLYVYAFLNKDTNQSSIQYRERASVAQELLVEFTAATRFVKQELSQIREATLNRYLDESTRLQEHDFFIRNILRQSEHILSEEGEHVLRAASEALQSTSSTYSVLVNNDIPWPEITLSDDTKVTLDPMAYEVHRASANRNDRKQVFELFWGTYQHFRQTLALTLEGQVKKEAMIARVRGFDSSLDRALSQDNIPEAVYRTLLSAANEHLTSLHRLLGLRQRMLGLGESRYYDLYTPAVTLPREFTLEQAATLTQAALTPLGSDYVEQLNEALKQRWLHAYPAPDKRKGAYVMGAAYDVHPFLMLNFEGTFDSVSTFAHEWGHAMHSLMANSHQPFSKSAYSSFISEIPATVNELLLFDYLRDNASSDDEKLFYLFRELNLLRSAFFRQAQFAEFELAIHEQVESGGNLSGDKLNTLYGTIQKRHAGHNMGIMQVDEPYTVEWASVSHFYRNFSVYQYATSMVAAYNLVGRIATGGEEARQQYLDILQAGGSDYPYRLLRNSGVDLADPAAYHPMIQRMTRLMDEVEHILDRQGAKNTSR
ncbi:MAG: M3 family oligoendopeptidase [Porticoccus sp.]|jgi:oligoendopeptidase F|uniref:M3 family oligoendopeptidase n=1 Tax=Porticoccus sp. TaxID=2024853 RepID=UPI000C5E4CCD|nr:M3 family oligoendopeptidase [Porticoccus sp.]MAZ70689.1 oligoendopeptidase F [Porticoccus sp.]|tara:strand:- start:2358 stop:4253 length:1896 start_codon:yes stop_codon:yes gene_type:complete